LLSVYRSSYPVVSNFLMDTPRSHQGQHRVGLHTDKRGFSFLNITQFFNAFNDNLLKQMLIFGTAAGGLWASQIGEGGQAIASLCLAVPFVLLSGFAGQFSDRYSKRTVMVMAKTSEIVIGIVALAGFLLVNLWLVITAMVLISIQSTFFSPAKYGILPEIIEGKLLSRANGTINMFTYIAAILGGAAGGPLYDMYTAKTFWWDWNWQWPEIVPPGIPGILWLPGVLIVLIGILGIIASRGIPRVTAQNPTMKIRPIFFKAYLETWRDIRGTALGTVVIAWSYFYMIVVGLAVLILPDYKELLHISATQTAGLMAILGISIGAGDFAAGRLSGHRIRPGMVPIGAIGTTLMMFVLGAIPHNYFLISASLSAAGFMAGFLMVPLQTMTQRLASKEQRGQVLGLWNCSSFIGVIVGNVIFLALKRLTGIASHHVFFICGGLGVILIVLLYTGWQKQFEEAVRPLGDEFGEGE
jgi:acyl-[acyl-carrier-protein]-phospholipid O-acyltransferase/long-chain-fatty-acid--[acyl-carrier-protein] ligase